MERALVAVERDGQGWRVSIGGHAVDCHPDKLTAMQRATDIARDCYESLGLPTGVKVRMGCGSEVMIGKCG
jgi:hypothetical protein